MPDTRPGKQISRLFTLSRFAEARECGRRGEVVRIFSLSGRNFTGSCRDRAVGNRRNLTPGVEEGPRSGRRASGNQWRATTSLFTLIASCPSVTHRSLQNPTRLIQSVQRLSN